MDPQVTVLTWWQTALILIPTLAGVFFYFKYSQKWYEKIQPYLERKFGVKMIFKRRHIEIVGHVSGLRKFFIELHYLVFTAIVFFGPWLILGLLAWLIGDYWLNMG